VEAFSQPRSGVPRQALSVTRAAAAPALPFRKFLRDVESTVLIDTSIGSKIGNYFLSLKVFGSGNRTWSQLLTGTCPVLMGWAGSFKKVC
jgi:hypothetical protein